MIFKLLPVTTQSEHRLQFVVAFFLIFSLFVVGCSVDQTQEGELPDVDVDVEPGQLPNYDIDGPEVQVGVREKTVTVPKLEVVMEEEQVTVPYVDVDLPGQEEIERTITVEVEVQGAGNQLQIQDVYLTPSRLLVISRLEGSGSSEGPSTRVSDRVVLKAPEDLDVRHYIIGQQPSGDFNDQYRFINNRQSVRDDLQSARLLYSREQSGNSPGTSSEYQ